MAFASEEQEALESSLQVETGVEPLGGDYQLKPDSRNLRIWLENLEKKSQMAETPPQDELPSPETPPSEEQPAPPFPQQRRGSKDVNVCPNCGWANSTNRVTCKQCHAPLPVVERPARPALPVLSRTRKWLYFAAGFTGWFLINGLAWLALDKKGSMDNLESEIAFQNAFCVLPLNGLVLLLLALIPRTRWIALGILAAWAFNLFISLLIGAISNGVCMVPFFIK